MSRKNEIIEHIELMKKDLKKLKKNNRECERRIEQLIKQEEAELYSGKESIDQ